MRFLAVLALCLVTAQLVLSHGPVRNHPSVASTKKFEVDRLGAYSFEQFQRDFSKKYSDSQRHFRQRLFNENVAKIIAHNTDKTKSWKMGVNKFTDMTEAERGRYVGAGVTSLATYQQLTSTREPAQLPSMDISDLPTAVDWRTVNPPIITPPKDQGGCGSCWAHAATESIESYVAMAGGPLENLSRQNLVDCVPNPNDCGGMGGCAGATAELGFEYVSTNGIATEAAYPYAGVNQQCNTAVQKVAKVASWQVLPNNNYTALIQAVATIGPLAINADANPWFSYSSGVFDGCSFGNIDINHVIQLVGYGTDNGADYWLVRNSWGPGWGEGGYIRMQRHSDGGSQWCGPDTKPQDGVGCNGGPSTVTVCGSCGVWFDTSYPTGASVIG